MIAEDPSVFLADFGQPCRAQVDGAWVSFVGLLDQPTTLMDLGRASAHSTEYELRYITGAVALARQVAVTVGSVAYTCREAPRQVGDGVFSTVMLTRT